MTVNGERLLREIDELAAISSHAAPAVTRVLFSPEDLQAREWLLALAVESGFSTRSDAVGNLFIRWEGSDPSLAPAATGSHTDAIPNAGKFDGVVGVLGGLEAMRALKEDGFRPRRSLELIMFTAEEPTRFGIGCLGSRLMAGTLDSDAARALRDAEENSLEELRASTCTGVIEDVALTEDTFHTFVELHIEQGPILEEEGIDIGVVEKIAAPASSRMTFSGTGGHAGAVLMPERKDAFLAAAEVALAVENAALGSPSPDTVGTTGVVQVEPGAINSIPCEAMLEIDFRDTDLEARDAALQSIQDEALTICERRGVEWSWHVINADPPALCDPDLLERIDAAAEAAGYSHRRLISRAYHDALFMARLCPTAMIFIPCYRGYSHRPDEFASPEAIAKGVRVLADTLKGLCR
ncbi:MAG: M20 family metallo-hydrolase [Verrucomicrobiota bacterium]